MKKPNIMVILMDDMGFSDPGCYGGEIETPNIDRLAQNGLRYTQFYSTPRCWPTRSSILTLPEGAPPLAGKSLVPSFGQDGGVERDHIYHHHQGNRALRVANWKIVNEALTDLGNAEDRWALYDLSTDRCEMHDLAAEKPDLLAQLVAKWQACEDAYRNPGTEHNALV